MAPKCPGTGAVWKPLAGIDFIGLQDTSRKLALLLAVHLECQRKLLSLKRPALSMNANEPNIPPPPPFVHLL